MLEMPDLLGEVAPPSMFDEGFGVMPMFGDASAFGDPGFNPEDGPMALQGEDLDRFKYRLKLSLDTARGKMQFIHEDAMNDRRVYMTMERETEYPGQSNLTTPISANKADGLLAHIVDAIEQRPLASFVPEGIGKPAEIAARVAPLAAAALEREINRGGSRERLIRDLSKEAVVVGTGIGRLSLVEHPSGEWFVKVADIIKIENFFVDRVAVDNLKHTFCGYEERKPLYQLEEMADSGLLDPEAVTKLRNTHVGTFTETVGEEAALFRETHHSFQEEVTVQKIFYCYMRFRAAGDMKAELYEAVWSDEHQLLLAVRKNPVREAFDHPPLMLWRVGKTPRHLFGRGVIRRLVPEQEMADNAINAHLALNTLAASPPFMYKQNGPFGRLMQNERRIVPGIGIPTLDYPSREEVKTIEIHNPGLSLQDVSVAQAFADRATYTEEAIGTSSDRKTLGQFRVEVQRGTMRVRLDLGDLAYDASIGLSMIWSMMVAYKVKPSGVIEVEEGGKFLGYSQIDAEEIGEVMNSIVLPLWNSDEVTMGELQELESEFNGRLTDGLIPSARRNDLTIHLTGTKIIADKATELDMLHQLTPYMLQGLELAKVDPWWNLHLRSIIDAMGFKDIDRRVPPMPEGQDTQDPMQAQMMRQQMGEMVSRSSNLF